MKKQAYQKPSIDVENICESCPLLVTSNHPTSGGPRADDLTPPDVYEEDEEEGY